MQYWPQLNLQPKAKIQLFEILVPTKYGDTLADIPKRKHLEWDNKVQALAGGLTVLSPAKGKWTFKGKEYPEAVIPVRIMCSSSIMQEIVPMTAIHFRQKAVMFYILASKVWIKHFK